MPLLLLGVACSQTTGEGTQPVTLDEGSSLTGTDANSDGVRDDVAQVIDDLAATPEMKQQLTDYAENQQRVMALDVSGGPAAEDEAYEIATETNHLVSCVPDDGSFDEFDQRTNTLDATMANTDARRAQMDAFEQLIDGRSFPEPTC